MRHSAHLTTLARPAVSSSLPRLAVTATLLTSLTIGCTLLHTNSSSPSPPSDSDPSPTTASTFPAPIKALQTALGVLLYQPSSPTPPIHNPSPPPGSLPSLRYPVVLVHGFLGYSSLLTNPLNHQPVFEYFGELRAMYEGAGYVVVVPVLPRSYKVERRAKALQVALGLTEATSEVVGQTGDGARQTQRVTPKAKEEKEEVQEAQHDAKTVSAAGDASGEEEGVEVLTNGGIDLTRYKGPFHLIAHSMGGLDSRYLIAHLQAESDNRIVSLTTISSPHHGSPLADLIVEQVQKERILPIPAPTLASSSISPPAPSSSPSSSSDLFPAFKIEHVVRFISDTFGLDFRGMLDLTTTAAKEFNKDTPNRADTVYQSYSGWRPFDYWSVWYVPSKLIESREGYNDGLVSVDSAKWGDWKGCLPLDHLQEVGLGVMHKHLDLYKEIAHGLRRIEDSRGEEEDRKEKDRKEGRRRHAGDGRRGGAEEQERKEVGAVQRKEEARDKAKEKGKQDAKAKEEQQ